MNDNTDTVRDAQPIGVLARGIAIRMIEAMEDPLQREERIRTALDERAIDYATAYELRQ